MTQCFWASGHTSYKCHKQQRGVLSAEAEQHGHRALPLQRGRVSLVQQGLSCLVPPPSTLLPACAQCTDSSGNTSWHKWVPIWALLQSPRWRFWVAHSPRHL